MELTKTMKFAMANHVVKDATPTFHDCIEEGMGSKAKTNAENAQRGRSG